MIFVDEHQKKMVAPIVITIMIIIYYIFYFSIVLMAVDGVAKLIFGVVPIILSIFLIRACRERIDEIKGGDEDDLSKY